MRLQPRANNSTTNLEPSASNPSLPIRIIPQPVTEELKKGGGKPYGEKGEKKREGETQRDMQIKLQPKITFNSAEKCKTLGLLSANVQDEVQTIYFIFIYFKTDAVALYFIIQDFQRRQTEFLQPN